MATCTVSGALVDPTGAAISGATIEFRLSSPQLDAANNLVAPFTVNTTTATDGTWSLSLEQGLSGILTVDYPPNSTDSVRRYPYSIVIPATATATFASLATEN